MPLTTKAMRSREGGDTPTGPLKMGRGRRENNGPGAL